MPVKHMQIVSDMNIPFVNEVFSPLGDVQLVPGRLITRKSIQGADILLIRSITPVDYALLDGSNVQFIATASIGTDHVNTKDLTSLGIGFVNAAGSNANSVAEYVIAALLEMGERHQFQLSEQTIGIIGLGNIGRKVARYSDALGMRILKNDPPRQRAEQLSDYCSFDTILSEADIITLHVPLTHEKPDSTYHMFSETVFDSMDKRPILINTARGSVVDNQALLTAITERKLRGTVFDVWEKEPEISEELLQAVDIGTPHIAGYSLDGKINGTKMIYEATCKYFGLEKSSGPLESLVTKSTIQPVKLNFNQNADSDSWMRQAVRTCFRITEDDDAFRASPQKFDLLRANYPIRREFHNTKFIASDLPHKIRDKLVSLGFKIHEEF